MPYLIVTVVIIGIALFPYLFEIGWSIGDAAASLFFDWIEAWKDLMGKFFDKGDD